MTEFDPEKFDEKYTHYFDELETAYSNAYQELHGERDSDVLRGIDRRILSESEPVYEGDGQFRVALPDDVDQRIEALPGTDDTVERVLTDFTAEIERELRRLFDFE